MVVVVVAAAAVEVVVEEPPRIEALNDQIRIRQSYRSDTVELLNWRWWWGLVDSDQCLLSIGWWSHGWRELLAANSWWGAREWGESEGSDGLIGTNDKDHGRSLYLE